MLVMAGLVPAIHAFFCAASKAWMPATSAGMTIQLNFISLALTAQSHT
jgi:hypothetical protein